MVFEKTDLESNVLILKRSPFEGLAITIDFDGVSDGVVKAGSPIGANGKVANDGTVKGILLFDVTEDRPIGTVVVKGYINTTVAEANAGLTIAGAVKTALPMVIFE